MILNGSIVKVLVVGLALVADVMGTTVTETATYDDLDRGLLQKPIGTYDNLTYQAFVLGNFVASTVPVKVGGVATRTPPNYAITSALIQGTAGTASVTPASPYTSLGLSDFYFGCQTAAQQGTATVAVQCTVTVAGFQAKTNKEVAVASFTFTPLVQNSLTQTPMIQASLPSGFWQGLGNVTFVQDNKVANLLVDNMHYTVTK